MPTEIKVVIPAPGVDDVMSIADSVSIADDTMSINEEYVWNDTNGADKSPNDLALDTDLSQCQDSPRDCNENNSPREDAKDTVRTPTQDSQTLVPENKATEVNSLQNAERRIRSARIENLLKHSNRHSLAAGVSKEIHYSRHRKENGTTSEKQLQKHKRPKTSSSKLQNKSSQTGDEERKSVNQNPVNDNDKGGEVLNTRGSRKTQQTRPSSSPANMRQRPVPQKPGPLKQVKLSITGTYDVEMEHHDIMLKAYNSYYQHRYKHKTGTTAKSSAYSNTNYDGDENNNINDIEKRTETRKASIDNNKCNGNNSLLRNIPTQVGYAEDEQFNTPTTATEPSKVPHSDRVTLVYDDDKLVSRIWADEKRAETSRRSIHNPHSTRGKRGKFVPKERPSSAMTSHDNMFKLAQCRLIYNENDDEEKKKKVRPKSSSWTERRSRSNDVTTGVLVDSVGHVYGMSKPRPLSALPCKFSVFLKEANKSGTFNTGIDRRNQDVFCERRISSLRDFDNIEEDNDIDDIETGPFSHRHYSSGPGDDNDPTHNKGDHQVKIVTLQLQPEVMDHPIPRAVAFNKRNRTTHSWSDSSSMSQSLPNASFLHKQFTTSPPPLTTRGASPARAGKPSKKPDRPSSSYSYDGGFFLGAHSSQAEYFVIHPDWVSEALTINKIGGSADKTKQHPQLSKLKLPQRRWSERRCMSAPPSKFRNPLSWDDSDAWPYVNKKDKV